MTQPVATRHQAGRGVPRSKELNNQIVFSFLVPEPNMGDVMSDINTKRGHVLGMESLPNGMQRITAAIPQAEMLHYTTDLRSITQSRSSFSMEFAQYAEVPYNVQQEIINQHKKQEKALHR